MSVNEKILRFLAECEDGATTESLEKELGYSRQYTVRGKQRIALS
jgi:hypothetical protein